ncbi:hypothetical protein OE88DRAFT_1661669 [Heliocybe sulcata]|uniref:DUF6534 domain-containing protein n=1 Tax=Heliocybe sulcata TaxID=5364 RepID=A0A5C3MX61_9AGAM|nr:hypothetical protein OE88DRAFT_1661669 [Heliocybe sulcata]
MSVVKDIAGDLLICIFIAAILYGVTCTQSFVYYQQYPGDRAFLKWMVGIIWVLETLHTAFCIDFIYVYTITHFGDEPFLDDIYWSGGITVILGVLVAGLVHAYYIRRLWIMSHGNKTLTGITTLLAVARFVFGTATTVQCYTVGKWTTFHEKRLPLVTLAGGLSSAAVVDIIVAVALIYLLDQNRSGFAPSDNRLKFIMAYTINTGALTTIFSVVIVITYGSLPSTLVFLGLVEIQSKLYANSFLASLNSRNHALKIGRDAAQMTPSRDPTSLTRSRLRNQPPYIASTQIEIFQETTQVFDDMPMGDFSKSAKPGRPLV